MTTKGNKTKSPTAAILQRILSNSLNNAIIPLSGIIPATIERTLGPNLNAKVTGDTPDRISVTLEADGQTATVLFHTADAENEDGRRKVTSVEVTED